MPTIRNLSGKYRFFFCSFDCSEPIHVHVQREKFLCKFWLVPIVLGKNVGFSPKELNDIRKLVVKYKDSISRAWHEHCGKGSRT